MWLLVTTRMSVYSVVARDLTNWNTPSPMGVAVDRSNIVYVTDYQDSEVREFTSGGASITNWAAQALVSSLIRMT